MSTFTNHEKWNNWEFLAKRLFPYSGCEVNRQAAVLAVTKNRWHDLLSDSSLKHCCINARRNLQRFTLFRAAPTAVWYYIS